MSINKKPKVVNMSRKFIDDGCMYISASVCFYCITSAIPFVLLLITIMGFFPIQISDLVRFVDKYIPEDLASIFNSVINSTDGGGRITMSVFYALVVVYSSAQVFVTIMDQLNKIYGINNTKSWIRRRLKAMGSSILFMFLIIFVLVAYVYGPKIAQDLNPHFPEVAKVLNNIAFKKLIIMPIIFIVAFAIAYQNLPDKKGKFIGELPGAIISAAGWVIFTEIYYYVVGHTQRFSLVYGGLANFIMALFWLYFGFMIFFFGAEFNTYIDRGWIWVPGKMKSMRRRNIRQIIVPENQYRDIVTEKAKGEEKLNEEDENESSKKAVRWIVRRNININKNNNVSDNNNENEQKK